MRNVRELVMKAKQENLNNDDIAYVIKKLEECKSTPDDDLYDYIYILGRGMYGKPIPPAYKKLVEHFLYYPQDSSISALALDVLFYYWKFTDDYLERLKMFIRGVEWDKDKEVRGKAITLAGIYLKDTHDKELLSLLIDIFEKRDKADAFEDFHRMEAYCALCLAYGLTWSQLPSYSASISDLERRGVLDLSVIEHAKKMQRSK